MLQNSWLPMDTVKLTCFNLANKEIDDMPKRMD